MTKTQQRIVNRLKKDVIEYDGSKDWEGKYEYKQWKVEEKRLFEDCVYVKTKTYVYVTCTVGMVNDEHTYASVLCRRYRMFMIGPRGGVKGLLGRKRTGYWNALIWSYHR